MCEGREIEGDGNEMRALFSFLSVDEKGRKEREERSGWYRSWVEEKESVSSSEWIWRGQRIKRNETNETKAWREKRPKSRRGLWVCFRFVDEEEREK